MSKSLLEKIAIGVSCVVLAGWAVFWVLQVLGVLEFLEMAYG
ncbi:MAG: hypothetical protein AAF525_10455 [Pseudomonadota bacterium]